MPSALSYQANVVSVCWNKKVSFKDIRGHASQEKAYRCYTAHDFDGCAHRLRVNELHTSVNWG